MSLVKWLRRVLPFFDVMGALLTGKCVYELLLGEYGDSLVRERVFGKLAIQRSYVIYDFVVKA